MSLEARHFQLLLHGVGSAPLRRPDPEAVAAGCRWLQQQGAAAHDAGFAVAGSAPRALFERLFGAPPPVPAALAPWVAEIAPSPPPELLGPQ